MDYRARNGLPFASPLTGEEIGTLLIPNIKVKQFLTDYVREKQAILDKLKEGRRRGGV